MRKTKIIIINSQKGGSLKSTTASNVSGLLSLREDTKVCLVDLDSQNDISISFNVDAEKLDYTITECLLDNVPVEKSLYKYSDNLDLLLSNARLEDYEFDVLTDPKKMIGYQTLLQEKLKPLYGKYDYIIVDSSPSFSILTVQMYMLNAENGLTTDIIIPFQPELYALKNLVRQINKVNKFKKMNDSLNIKAVIPTKTQANNTHKMIMTQIKQMLSASDILVTDTQIRNSIKFTEYMLINQKPLALEEDSKLNKEYKQFKDIYVELLKELDL